MTAELHIFKFLLNDEAKAEYTRQLPILGEAFENTNYYQADQSWQFNNYKVLTQLYDCRYGADVSRNGTEIGDPIMPYNIYRGILQFYACLKQHWPMDMRREFFELEYHVSYACHYDMIWKNTISREDRFECLEVCARSGIPWESIQDFLMATFTKKLSGPNTPCRTCKNIRESQVDFTIMPKILRIESCSWKQSIMTNKHGNGLDSDIVIVGINYKLVAVVYNAPGHHFRSRFLRPSDDSNSNLVCWEYDGMYKRYHPHNPYVVLCNRVLDNELYFPFQLTG
jgi:hypothetical protein